jgi:hypothetical protein
MKSGGKDQLLKVEGAIGEKEGKEGVSSTNHDSDGSREEGKVEGRPVRARVCPPEREERAFTGRVGGRPNGREAGFSAHIEAKIKVSWIAPDER